MLSSLAVRNFALLEDTSLEFTPGFTVLTGETGAGKTIVLEALGLALGERANSRHLRQGASRLTVAAVFTLPPARLASLRKSLDLPLESSDEPLILRREVDASGKSRCFLNDQPVSLATLGKLGERLAYAHGQHEHQLLLKPSEQKDLLDAYGGLESLREKTAAAFGAWKDLKSEQEALSLSEQERAQRVDLYLFQKKELETAGLKPEEEAELERLLPQLKNADKLKSLSQEVHGLLSGEEGAALERMQKAQRPLESLLSLGADLAEARDMATQALVNLEETCSRLETYIGKLEVDPQKIEEVLSRLDLIARLKKKYGPALQDVVDYRAKVEAELDRLQNLEGRSQGLSQRIAQAEKDLGSLCDELSKGRAAAAKTLAKAVEKEFKDVGLAQAAFDIEVKKDPEGQWSASGQDQVQFIIAPNPGEGKKPLAAVASGGELSRVMLCLQSVFAKTGGSQVLIFDEIDAGVGGVLGSALGKKLARLSKDRQVLCITHLATMAAFAQGHFFVEKIVEKDRTRTQVRPLPAQERVQEIARMFGTADSGRESIGLQHARELLETSKI